jgi:large subunit ribosomal protein L25
MAATLTAEAREGAGKGVARKLRHSGRIPAVLYGHGDATRQLAVSAHDLEKLLGRISVENTVVSLSTPDGAIDVLIREVQHHPFKPEVYHVDFLQLHGDETLTLQIPVRVVGIPRGVEMDSGVLDQQVHDLTVVCLPRNIPEGIEVDVSGLGVGDSIRVSDLSLPDGVHTLTDPEQPIASVHGPRVREAEEAEGTEGGAA